jgi:hypothetical protein
MDERDRRDLADEHQRRHDWVPWFQDLLADLLRRPRSIRAAGQLAQDVLVGVARLVTVLVTAGLLIWAALGRR